LHHRLALVDPAHGAQPFREAHGCVLVGNGEIYNAQELRALLAGTTTRSRSDCEVPLHLYVREGIDFLSRLRGMYALAIYDPRVDRLVLTRDPFGIKPLYYTEG